MSGRQAWETERKREVEHKLGSQNDGHCSWMNNDSLPNVTQLEQVREQVSQIGLL